MAPELQQHEGINVAMLERDLTSLWTQIGEEDPHKSVTRSCVLNLVIYAAPEHADYRLDETLIEVTEHHPSRAIILIEDEQGVAGSLSSWVTSRCALPTSNSRQVCCEQITIKASSDKVRETPSAISSLVLADLPVFLWWRKPLRHRDPLFRRYLALADRLLIDSATADFASAGFAEIVDFIGAQPRVPIADLNWTRLLTWRSILAGFYDSAEYRAALEGLCEMDITYHGEADTPLAPRAVYLAAWMASRLGWKINRQQTSLNRSGASFTFSRQEGEIVIHLRAVEGASERLGHLNEVSLNCGGRENPSSVFRVSKTKDGKRLAESVTLDGARRPERVLGYDRWPDSSLLAIELEGVARDRVFEQTALVAKEMVQSAVAVQG